jgi:hypothetical protein
MVEAVRKAVDKLIHTRLLEEVRAAGGRAKGKVRIAVAKCKAVSSKQRKIVHDTLPEDVPRTYLKIADCCRSDINVE